jgi:hypothetical protein
MTDQHPITPPEELLEEWATEYWGNPGESIGCGEKHIAIQAARWGADQELEACCEWLVNKLTFREDGIRFADELCAARRPKPPSLKEQALALVSYDFSDQPCLSEKGFAIIRRALEALPND